MMPASTKAGGQCLGFPDVCKTPAPPAPFVPVPYPNMAMPNQGNPGTMTKKVKIGNMAAMQKGSEIPMSSGDEAGSIGGIISSCIKGKAEFMLYSFDVKLDGKNACRLGDPLFHNKKNIMG